MFRSCSRALLEHAGRDPEGNGLHFGDDLFKRTVILDPLGEPQYWAASVLIIFTGSLRA
jgi:hypothetical protein